MELFKQLLQNPILNGLGFILGIISLISAYFFYRESLRLKKPRWDIRSNNIIEDFSSALKDLSISYKGQKVENVTVSRIVFWNDGKETINHTDIVSANPLRIVSDANVRLLDTRFLATNNEPSQFSALPQPDQMSAFLDFEYLDHKQGALIQIIHTGTSSRSIKIVGTIKGAQVLRKDVKPNWRFPLITPSGFDEFVLKRFSPSTRRKLIKTISLLVIVFTLVSLCMLAINLGTSSFEVIGIWGTLAAFFGMNSLVVFLWYGFGRDNRAPSGLEGFDEDKLI